MCFMWIVLLRLKGMFYKSAMRQTVVYSTTVLSGWQKNSTDNEFSGYETACY